jgi:hypothetical protein
MHPKMQQWGVGQVTATDSDSVTVYFEAVGEKKLKTNLVDLRKVTGTEAESSVLDSKFKAKRKGTRRRAYDPSLYNGGRSTSRKHFIESLGATCANWNWSWSFVNHDDKKIFFGAWQDFIEGNRALIFSHDWKTRQGKNRPSWPESRENIRLIEDEGYSLHVYTMILDPDSESEFGDGPRKIGAILNDVAQAELVRDGDDWFAVFPDENV